VALKPPSSLIATAFPAGPARNRALGVYGAMAGLGAVVGLLLGGAPTDYLSWRWVLFVNVPIAAMVLLGTVVLVEGDHDRGGVDLPGALTATAGYVSLVYTTNRAGTPGWSDGLSKPPATCLSR
jgi:MFS family permease